MMNILINPQSKIRYFMMLLVASIILLTLALPTRTLAAIGILSVQPSTISSVSSAVITITGIDFLDGAVAQLSGYGNLTTRFIDATTIEADVPAGLPPGTFNLTVVNPDSSSATLENALTVTAPTPTATATLPPPTPTTKTAQQTATPTETEVPLSDPDRPLVVVDSYSASSDAVKPGESFNLSVRLENIGESIAFNLIAIFTPGDFIPRESGGVLARTELDPDESKKFTQPLTASQDLIGRTYGTIVVQISYSDANGVSYAETFNISVALAPSGYGPAPTETPTPTAQASLRPQLVITGYQTSEEILKPGTRFLIGIRAQNVGNADAKRVTMILGGGSSSGGSINGTPDTSGGVSGAGGDFGNFAPVAASNVQFLGDVDLAAGFETRAELIVNASTQPGAYPMKISFTYLDDKGNAYTDDQVITLLVYAPPHLEVNFYRPPDPLFVGQPGMLPLQVLNLGRKTAILGNMKVDGQGAEFINNVILVGALDIGGYYTLDATVIPGAPGPMELLIRIDYTDDYNQAQVITRTLEVMVEEAFIPEPGPDMDGGIIDPGSFPSAPETFWQKVLRFVRGLIGLDSGVPTPAPGDFPGGELPVEEFPSENSVPVPRPKG